MVDRCKRAVSTLMQGMDRLVVSCNTECTLRHEVLILFLKVQEPPRRGRLTVPTTNAEAVRSSTELFTVSCQSMRASMTRDGFLVSLT